jgi:tartrate-resistant acid phosphatase type 5
LYPLNSLLMNTKRLFFYLAFGIVFYACGSKSIVTQEEWDTSYEEVVKAEPTDLRFFVIGDWGREGAHGQAELAKVMGQYAELVKPQFIISTGDNFYPSGVNSTRDMHWTRSFTDVYTHRDLHVDWYPVLGNHDIQGSVKAQFDYGRVNPVWKFPAAYYRKSFATATDSVLFVFIDTNPFDLPYYDSPTYGKYVSAQDTTAQKKWLDSVLAHSDHRWKIVVGHHPMYTAGARAANENTVRRSLEPILEKHGVDAYLAGHEHDIQHHKPEGRGVAHFVSGAGSALRGIRVHDMAEFAQSVNAFLVVTVKEDKAIFEFVTTEGKVVYTTEIVK